MDRGSPCSGDPGTSEGKVPVIAEALLHHLFDDVGGEMIKRVREGSRDGRLGRELPEQREAIPFLCGIPPVGCFPSLELDLQSVLVHIQSLVV